MAKSENNWSEGMWEIFEHTQQLTSPSGNISGTHFCHSLSPSQSHIVAGRIM